MDKLREWLSSERGRVTELAAACGVTHSAVLQWKQVPAERCREVEAVTGIPRKELRPDIFGSAAA